MRGTSVRDLGEAMGLGQASVYNAFGVERDLLIQCLDRYLVRGDKEDGLGVNLDG
jgi:hypothetical protein